MGTRFQMIVQMQVLKHEPTMNSLLKTLPNLVEDIDFSDVCPQPNAEQCTMHFCP